MRGRARVAAARALADVVETYERLGYRTGEQRGLDVRLEHEGRTPLHARLAPAGRIFGGSFALEVSTAEPVLPPTRGLSARGRGVVRLTRVAFRAAHGDERGTDLANALERDAFLCDRLAAVHFERIRVEPDGRPVIRHMGGSVVWVLFPPIVRAVPLVAGQARAVADALEAFAGVGAAQATAST
ncbi:MAG TPA: DUF3156 family protein [Gaiellaceae bacterium]|nr:DUF3156 family protein [Gaiellaceae bacterium]